MAEKSGQAGKSTRQMAEKRRNTATLWLVGGLVLAVAIYLLIDNWQALGIGGFGLLILLFLLKALPDLIERKTKKIDKMARRADRGAKAEEVVGELLDELDENFMVLNDIDSPYGNIDHVVINRENGIFLLETKSHHGRVVVEDGEILLNGHAPEKNFIGQALQNSYWLRDVVKAKLGVTAWVTPVLVFTNAFVPGNRGVKGVRVVNKKYLTEILRSKANPAKENKVLWERRQEVVEILAGNDWPIMNS